MSFQRILDTQDMDLINAALDLAERDISAQAELLAAQIAKGRALINDESPRELFAANERIHDAEVLLEQIRASCDTLMQVVDLHHSRMAVSRFGGQPPVYVAGAVIIGVNPSA